MRKKVTILSISFSYEKGGAERSLKNLITELRAQGIKIFLFTSPFLKSFYEEKGTYVHSIPFFPSMALFTKYGKIKLLNIYALLKRIFIVLIYSWRISRLCKRKKVNIIHINDFKGGIFIPFLKVLTRLKIVWHIRDLFAWESRWKRYYYKFFGNFADLLIANSPLTEKMVKEIGLKNVRMIYNIIEISPRKFYKRKARRLLKLPEDRFIVGYIGRISKEKEIEKLIESLSLLKNSVPDIFCVIVGDDFKGGGERMKLIEYVKRVHLEDYIRFIGWQENIEDYYLALDLFVYPREKTYEPFGRSVVESMFYGVPVLVSDKFRWLIKDRENGFIFEGEKKGLSKKIIEIYYNKDQLKFISQNAREIVEKKFNKDKLVQEFLKVFKNLIYKDLGER